MKFFSLLIIAGTVGVAAAQQTPSMGEMESRVAAAQAQARRPGDESLSCGKLEAELKTIFGNSRLQAVVQSQNAFAQGQFAHIEAGKKQAEAAQRTPYASLLQGMSGGMMPPNPVTARAQQAAAAAQGAKVAEQVRKNDEALMANLAQIMEVMPLIARGSRVVELAIAKDCAFMTEGPPLP